MACPFLRDPVDIGAQIVRRALRKERVFRDRQDPLAFSDDILYDRYGFSAGGISYLCKLLDPYVAHATRRSQATTTLQTVCIALRFFATGKYLHDVGDAENLSKNTVFRSIRKVAEAFSELIDVYVVFPGHLPTPVIKEGFSKIAGFPRVIGAIDCTHIPITVTASLAEEASSFINKDCFYSLNVQMTCDHDFMVTSLDARWPGSVKDFDIFQRSTLYQRFEEGLFDGILVGDSSYSCQSFLITPHADPQTEPQERFNAALGRTQATVEQTVGVIKARFACLRRLRVSPLRASQIVSACVVLHNIASIRKERTPPVPPRGPDVVAEDAGVAEDHPSGVALRDDITARHFA